MSLFGLPRLSSVRVSVCRDRGNAIGQRFWWSRKGIAVDRTIAIVRRARPQEIPSLLDVSQGRRSSLENEQSSGGGAVEL